MKRNTRDLFFQVGKDIKSISILIAILGALSGKILIWNHLADVNNDIDYRELLSVMIGVLTTIVVTTYSLTIVALQLASVQFSPRILRSFFTDDRFNQVVLGCFIATITYLMLLKTWAPRTLDIPIAVGLVLAILLICVVFPLFIAHIADCINAGSIVRRIAFNLLDEIDKHYGMTKVCAADFPISQQSILPSENAIRVFSTQSGYIESTDYQQFDLFFQQIKNTLATKGITGITLFQTASAGEFVAEGIPLFAVEIEEKSALKRSELEVFLTQNKAIQRQLHRIVKVEKYRSYKQDINFGIRQLVDIAIKAISPAVNDPTTCINSLDYLSMVLRRLVQCPPQCLAHQDFPPYLRIKEFGFREYIDHAFDQIYHFGKGDFIIVCRVLRALRYVAEVTDYQPYVAVLKAEFEDIKTDILQLENTFTKEGFIKIKKEIEACEKALM